MKQILFLLFAAVGITWGQSTVNSDADCPYSVGVLSAVGASTPYYNSPTNTYDRTCTSWIVSYSTVNATGVSLAIEGAADNNGVPTGSWTSLTAATTPVASANPATGTNYGSIRVCCDFYPWIRLHVVALTGTGATITIRALGYRGTFQAAAGGGSGGGSGTFNALTGDATSTATGGSTTVTGLKGASLPSLATGYLNYNSGWVLTALGTAALANTATACSGNQWSQGWTTGSNNCSQVAFSNLSGSATASQVPAIASITNYPLTTAGDLFIGGASGAAARLADVATGSVLISGGIGVAPSWSISLPTNLTFPSPGTIGGTTPGAASFTTLNASGTVTFSAISGSTQCLQVNSSGVVSGTGSACGSGGSTNWNSIGNPTGNLTLSMGTNTTTFNQTSGAAWTWANTTAATSGASQSSPIMEWLGTEWHGGASVAGGFTAQFVPGTGTDAASTLTISHAGSATGPMTTSFPGPISASGDGVHAGVDAIVCNTTLPTLVTSQVNLIGANAAGCTAYGLQFPTAAAAGVWYNSAPSSSVSAISFGNAPLSVGGTGASLTASNGGIFYSTASTGAILAGTATASLPLLSSATAAPVWATITYPASATSGGVLYLSSATAISSSSAGAAKQLMLWGGAGTAPYGSDFPEHQEVPFGNCVGTTAGSGLNLPASSGFAAACLTQSNTNQGVLTAAQSTSAQTPAIHLPADWDSASTTYLSMDLDQGNYTTASSTVVMSAAIGCSSTPTSNPAFQTAQAFSTVTTGTTAYQSYNVTVTLNSTSLTNCTAGGLMFIKLSRGSGDTAGVTPDLIDLNITLPRKLTLQAN